MAVSNRELGIKLLGVWLILSAVVNFGLVLPGIGLLMGILALVAGLMILIGR